MIAQKTVATALVALGGLVSLGCASLAQESGPPAAQPDRPAMEQSQTGLSASDEGFMMQAAEAGIAEVRFGELAQQRATSTAVKQYGQHLVEDHTQANSELVQLAADKGVPLPEELSDRHKELINQLSQLEGESFDRAFMTAMVEEHRNVVSLFQNQTEGGQDADVRGWAAKTLPALQEHLRRARDIAQAQ